MYNAMQTLDGGPLEALRGLKSGNFLNRGGGSKSSYQAWYLSGKWKSRYKTWSFFYNHILIFFQPRGSVGQLDYSDFSVSDRWTKGYDLYQSGDECKTYRLYHYIFSLFLVQNISPSSDIFCALLSD